MSEQKARVRTGKLNEFRPAAKNPNRHTPRGLGAIESSMQEVGYVTPMTVAADGESLDGSARMEKSATVFGEDVLVVEHDGTKPVVMVRTDIPNAETPVARKVMYLANRTAELDLAWDAAQIAADLEAGMDLAGMFDKDELAEILEQTEDTEYSRKVEAPIYQPSNAKPSIHELYNEGKTQKLLQAIQEAKDVTEEERQFLAIAAQRHTVLFFNRIADYYAHSGKEMQALMEQSALVIIDFNKAVEFGFVQLTEAIAGQVADEYDG